MGLASGSPPSAARRGNPQFLPLHSCRLGKLTLLQAVHTQEPAGGSPVRAGLGCCSGPRPEFTSLPGRGWPHLRMLQTERPAKFLLPQLPHVHSSAAPMAPSPPPPPTAPLPTNVADVGGKCKFGSGTGAGASGFGVLMSLFIATNNVSTMFSGAPWVTKMVLRAWAVRPGRASPQRFMLQKMRFA